MSRLTSTSSEEPIALQLSALALGSSAGRYNLLGNEGSESERLERIGTERLAVWFPSELDRREGRERERVRKGRKRNEREKFRRANGRHTNA